MNNVENILSGYLDAIEFTDCGPDDDERQNADWSKDGLAEARLHVEQFLDVTPSKLLHDIPPAQIGHDLWLTRNGHGAGFWDRGLGAQGDSLTAICEALGQVDSYVADDGFLYLQGGLVI